MSYLEKLLDFAITNDAKTLIVNIGEKIQILKEDKTYSATPEAITEKEYNIISTEYEEIFKGKEVINYKNNSFNVKKKENHIEFTLIENTENEEKKIVENIKTASSQPIKIKATDIDWYLKYIDEKNASDIHLSSKCKPIMRLDGDMVILDDRETIEEDSLFEGIKKIAPEKNIDELLNTNDTDFAYEIKGLARFRVNVFRDHKGICAVFRLIPNTILTVEQLNLTKAMIDLCEMPKGLILVTGPTGCGKSTTLATLIDYINKNQKKHIITIEDPIEFVHNNKLSLINQREIGTHTKSFKKALRAALREDPDVVLVGEMRDLETIAIAIETAVTGHLVFGTLHTSTAIGTVDRVVDQFPADRQEQIRMMCADALIGVISQVLCKRKGGGRIAAYEVLIGTPPVANLIRESKTFQIQSIMQTSRGIGMKLMNDHLKELVEKGLIEAKEAISKSVEKEPLKKALIAQGLL